MNKIKIEQFGKDHWSLLAYVEYRAVNHNGLLDKSHLRIKNPVVANSTPYPIPAQEWKEEWGTRLFGYWNKDGTTNQSLKLGDHDDLDCLDDLEEAGLIKNFGTGLNPASKLTKFGAMVMSELNLHKQNGGNFSEFVNSIEKLSDDSETLANANPTEDLITEL